MLSYADSLQIAAQTWNRDYDALVIESFLEEMSLCADSHVLEIGSGTGELAILLQRITGAAVCGTGPPAGMPSCVRAKHGRVAFERGDAGRWPFPDRSFDFAFMIDVVHRLPGLAAMFDEAGRVLRPAGALCIDTQSHRQIRDRSLAEFFPSLADGDLRRYPDIGQIIAEGLAHGFLFIKTKVTGHQQLSEFGPELLAQIDDHGFPGLQLLSQSEFALGRNRLAGELAQGPIVRRAAGRTQVWLARK